MTRSIPATILAACLALPGCCAIAHLVCPCPAPTSPTCLTRETPDAALDFLVDSFRNRRIGDIYATFHPSFVRENGGFSQEEFSVAYEKFEQDFAADAESLSSAQRELRDATMPDGTAVVRARLVNAAAGAEVVLYLENRPKIRVVTSNVFLPPIEGVVDKASLVRLSGGHLGLPEDFALTSIENVRPETVNGLTGKDVVRVEFADDWVVRLVPPGEAKGIRFLDKLKETIGR